MKMPAIAAALLMTVAGANVDAAPLPGFAPVAQSEHFTFYGRNQGEKVDVSGSEKTLRRIAALLGQTEVPRSDVFLHETAGDVAAVTGLYAGGVTYPQAGQIHTTDDARDHEIVHRVAHLLGDPGSFFQEGLAVALGDKAKWQGQQVDRVAKRIAGRVSIQSLIASFKSNDPQLGYAVAGSFVNWLIKTHGIDTVVKFFRASKGEQTSVVFAQAFGQSLDNAGASWAREI
jgi:hypothetical protein